MTDQTPDPQIHIHDLGQRARKAARALLSASTEAKNNALREAAKALRSRTKGAMTKMLERRRAHGERDRELYRIWAGKMHSVTIPARGVINPLEECTRSAP